MTARQPNAIEKALDVLMLFAPSNRELGVSEISSRLGLHAATANRVIKTLAGRGFLQQNRHSRKYHLGPAVMELANALYRSLRTEMVQLARPYLEELRDALGETVVFEVWTGNATYIAHVEEGPQRVRIAGTVGDRLPAHAAAGAKAILAYSEEERVERALAEGMPRHTPSTITDPEEFRRQLRVAKKRGYAVDREEIDVGINAVAAPVFDHRGQAVAAVVVAGPSPRISGTAKSAHVRLVRETAQRITLRLQMREGSGEEGEDAMSTRGAGGAGATS
ncbi:IclR family transcriptional regulator [Candidatus Solincola sp.]|jgi:DNA-binding IclR family transcriptional regulator|nr:IclR family transcriptional regulator [Actinomycetota bacterium]MDI7251048.1 IclR family transcriptional regulator [Actinomycetota bacterium]